MSSVVIPAAARTEKEGDAAAVVARLQHLPCRIEHRGPAKVDEFFTPLVRETAPGGEKCRLGDGGGGEDDVSRHIPLLEPGLKTIDDW